MTEEYNIPVETPKKDNKTTIIIIVVVVVLLCCCCCAISGLAWTYGDQIMKELDLGLRSLPLLL